MQTYSPRFRRDARLVESLRSKLTEQHKDFAAAGSQAGGYWTPFKETCGEVLRLVRQKPGITLKELMGSLKHHYSSNASARSSLIYWADRGKIRGVRLERKGRLVHLFPSEDEIGTDAEE